MKLTSKILATATSLAMVVAFSGFGAAAAIAEETAGAVYGTSASATPFTASVGGIQVADVQYGQGSYKYVDYPAPDYAPVEVTADLYTVAIPAGTTKVTLSFGKPCLAYNYSAAGDYIAGWVEDYTIGLSNVEVDIDAAGSDYATGAVIPADGQIDYIRVQNPYNADYSGGELLYAITFVYEEPAIDGPGGIQNQATVSGVTYAQYGKSGAYVSAVKKTLKTVTIASTVKLSDGKKYTVKRLPSGIFKSSKATTIVIKTTSLTKSSVKNCLKGNKTVKTIKVPKSKLKAYKKIFTKANCGKTVTVKAA